MGTRTIIMTHNKTKTGLFSNEPQQRGRPRLDREHLVRAMVVPKIMVWMLV